jgi:hypothetical protein
VRWRVASNAAANAEGLALRDGLIFLGGLTINPSCHGPLN